MKKLALGILVALCAAPSLLAQSAVSVPLRNPQAAVVSTYAQLSTQRLADRRSMYSILPAPLQADLWSLQLSYFLADHTDLPQAQKAIVFEALGLFQSGLFEVDRSSSAWRTSTLPALEQLEGRARKEGSKILMDALTQLGGPEIIYPTIRANALRSEISVGGECECNTTWDFCCFGPECSTSTTPNCRRTRPYCIGSAQGCGLGWAYDCNGICGA
ncbi:MAG TPA: bacteriocin fulvocin C-related protein [Thermoanaerobaculia bacterium]|nr:bacteriocin fulvocin C-related protein [Thermoanaerobaculia bacterium]